MADTLANVRLAIAAGRGALAHVPAVVQTVVPTMADSLLPVEVQADIVDKVGTIPSPDTILGGFTVAGPYKVVWTFIGADNNEWTETFYTNSGGSQYAIAEGITPLATLRAGFLATVFSLAKVRVSDMSQPHASYEKLVAGVSGTAPLNPVSGITPPEVTLVYRLYAADGTFVNHFFRGWPGGQVNNPSGNGIFGVPSLDPAVQAFADELKNRGYGWNPIAGRSPVPGNALANNPIVTVNGTVNQNFPVVTCINPIQPQTGLLCNFSKCDTKTLPGLKGTFQMYNVSGNTFQIIYTTPTPTSINANGGYIRNNARAGFKPFAAVGSPPKIAFFHAQGEHKVKNLFGRGRRGKFAPGIRTSV